MAGGAGSRKAAEKERSYGGAGSKKVKKDRAAAGSRKAAEKERALVMLSNLELDEGKARAGSKTEKVLQQNPVPALDLEFPSSFEPLLPLPRHRQEEEEGGESGRSSKAAGAGKRRKTMTYRLGMEYADFVAENPLPPLYLPDPSLLADPGIIDLQERFVARQMAEREERDRILRQLEEFGYADVEVEVPDEDDEIRYM